MRDLNLIALDYLWTDLSTKERGNYLLKKCKAQDAQVNPPVYTDWPLYRMISVTGIRRFLGVYLRGKYYTCEKRL